VLPDPPVPGVEIGEKGYINQRAVLTRRADVVERLYATAKDPDVIGLEEEMNDE
jgi:feruloyl-CoA synthase